jgi:hypothetical protein
VRRLLVLVVAAILGAATVAGTALAGAAAGPAGGPVPSVDRVLADPPPDSHLPAEMGGGVNTVPCPNCWT